MKTDVENLWVFALAFKFKSLFSTNFACFTLLLVLTWLAINLIFWAHPGGTAWGKHKWRNFSSIPINKPIPGPKGAPIIGSMKLMMGLAHHKIAAMAESFQAKRLMAFSLGETRVIVTCNPDVAKEILNSSVFADRPVKESAYCLMFNRAIGFAPYGVYWRTLRRIAATHLFCPKQIKASETQRVEIYNQMLDSYNTSELDELRELVDQGYELLGTLNWSDHLPWFADFDVQKIRFRCSKLVARVNRFVRRIIEERKTETATPHRDFLDVLLSLQEPDRLSDSDMLAVLWEMIFRGTDTVAVLIEWILARMVMHPDVQARVHDELDKVVGRSSAVTESNITEMVYLSAVVKEVLRLHPPGPLLSWARLAITDSIVDGYHVPCGTTAMVNMWAITRDPDIWEDALKFNPDRFLSENNSTEFSVMGSDMRLAPFGSGRRTCPGKTLGLTTVTFWVASLLHEFEFRHCCQNNVDLSEVLKLSCEMANPLKVRVRPRRPPIEPHVLAFNV
ncbi:Cytochrome [Abeliophyllum distichum]|uniref:Cytochrome n=1 Tax=Abeliophyllum distichum TaxID=126358 RepID=A0ABD1PC44_9LAMI